MGFEIQMRGKKGQGKSFYHRGTLRLRSGQAPATEDARRMGRGWVLTGEDCFGETLERLGRHDVNT